MTELRFDEQVAIITGAARGLGFAYAELLGTRGASVVVNDVQDAEGAVSKLTARGITAISSQDDISTPAGASKLVAGAIGQFGHVDIVVNNAGIGRVATQLDEPDDLFETVLKVNLAGTRHVAHAVWPHFVERGYGRLINTTSAIGLYGFVGQSAYGSSKGGVYGLTRTLAAEAGELDIRVNAVAPGAFTPMVAASNAGPEVEERMKKSAPTSLVSPVVALLAHRSCPASGQVFEVGAGRVALVFVAETLGYYDRQLTPESVLENWAQVLDRTDYEIPAHAHAVQEIVGRAAARAAASRG